MIRKLCPHRACAMYRRPRGDSTRPKLSAQSWILEPKRSFCVPVQATPAQSSASDLRCRSTQLENSPAFQRWVGRFIIYRVPPGTTERIKRAWIRKTVLLKRRCIPLVLPSRSGLAALISSKSSVKTLGYCHGRRLQRREPDHRVHVEAFTQIPPR